MTVVLLVEDNITFRKWVKDILLARIPKLGIIEASEGLQAMQEVRNSCPDVIVMDIGLPGKNGLEVMREIREQCPLQKVMFLTNYSSPEYREAAEQMGVEHFLDKGTTKANKIIRCLTSLLGESK